MNDLNALTGRNHFKLITTTATLKKWGKGIALVLPDTLVKAGRLATGNEVEVNLSGQRIKIRKTTASSDIEKMCEAITPSNLTGDVWQDSGMRWTARLTTRISSDLCFGRKNRIFPPCKDFVSVP